MKTKLEMAHEYALEMLKRGDPEWRIVTDAWNLADTMYLENAERENIVCQDLSQEDWQPDWDRAPEWAKWWAMDKDGESYYFGDKPEMESTTWMPTGTTSPVFLTQSNYQGDWKDSLRERPE